MNSLLFVLLSCGLVSVTSDVDGLVCEQQVAHAVIQAGGKVIYPATHAAMHDMCVSFAAEDEEKPGKQKKQWLKVRDQGCALDGWRGVYVCGTLTCTRARCGLASFLLPKVQGRPALFLSPHFRAFSPSPHTFQLQIKCCEQGREECRNPRFYFGTAHKQSYCDAVYVALSVSKDGSTLGQAIKRAWMMRGGELCADTAYRASFAPVNAFRNIGLAGCSKWSITSTVGSHACLTKNLLGRLGDDRACMYACTAAE